MGEKYSDSNSLEITQTMSNTGTRHERIVMFLGAGVKYGGKTNEIFLVTEWMNGGNLADFLWGQRMVAWNQRIQILMDCLEGLAYLHLLHKSVHCDLKSPNILLERASSDDGLVRAKLGDFGLSRIFTYVYHCVSLDDDDDDDYPNFQIHTDTENKEFEVRVRKRVVLRPSLLRVGKHRQKDTSEPLDGWHPNSWEQQMLPSHRVVMFTPSESSCGKHGFNKNLGTPS